jgi:UPF0716 protein FxsA
MARTEKQTTRRPPIGRILLILLILAPIVEIAVLIQVGSRIGVAWTIALILLTALLGGLLVRVQGLAVLRRAFGQLEQGIAPVGEVFEAVCLAVGGVLLLLPGFVTDGLGILLLLPPVRRWLYRRIKDRLPPVAVRPGGAQGGPGRGPVVEGQFEEVPDPPAGPGGPPSMPPPRGSWDRPR